MIPGYENRSRDGAYFPIQDIFKDHFHDFADAYDTLYAKEYGMFRPERVTRISEKFLTCGDYAQGIARIRCTNPACRHEIFLPFSCKGFHPLGGPLHRLCPGLVWAGRRRNGRRRER
jgi:hypothetical protein